jgi:hypothetical protein
MDALLTGAYDLRTVDSTNAESWVNIGREPGATCWMPTYDEWAVASFYDPNKMGAGEGGWWSHLNRRERPSLPGAPGVGETSARWDPPGGDFQVRSVPVGSYPESQSGWGLLDTSGSVRECLEVGWEYSEDRLFVGTEAGWTSFPDLDELHEQIGYFGATSPFSRYPGIRLASVSVPSPTGTFLVVFLTLATSRRRSQ